MLVELLQALFSQLAVYESLIKEGMVDQTQKKIYLLPYTIYSYKNKKECNE